MTTTLKGKLVRAALLAMLAFPISALVPSAIPLAAEKANAAILAEHKDVLVQYGTFQQDPKYGEVWIPTVTPQGWHPYQPCHWVYTKYGWYFDDKTPWGAIVHHYGRWVHSPTNSWMWVPGEEYSPGWVVWKSNQEWVGWAPTPPDQDMKTLDVQAFNSDKMWIFMETDKFGKSCDGGIAPAAQIPSLLTQTAYIHDIAVVDGIVVFVFPPWLVGPIVDVDIVNVNVNVWSPTFIVNIVNIWNTIWNINVNIACIVPDQQPTQLKPLPLLKSNPPPAPGKRTEYVPTHNPDPGRPGFTPHQPRPPHIVDRFPRPPHTGGNHRPVGHTVGIGGSGKTGRPDFGKHRPSGTVSRVPGRIGNQVNSTLHRPVMHIPTGKQIGRTTQFRPKRIHRPARTTAQTQQGITTLR